MLRKLIILAITSGVATKLYKRYNARPQTPFPTARHHPPKG